MGDSSSGEQTRYVCRPIACQDGRLVWSGCWVRYAMPGNVTTFDENIMRVKHIVTLGEKSRGGGKQTEEIEPMGKPDNGGWRKEY